MKEDIENQVRQYLVERGWDNLRPSDLAKSISIEAAELLEIFQWTSMTLEETKQDTKKMAQLRAELADVLIYALDMAVLLDINTEQIITEKIEKINRKYPAALMKQANTKEPGTDDTYLRIKREHRRQADD